MGEHDQAVLQDEDAHEDIHDDGRRFRPLGRDESPDLDSVAFYDAQLTPVFRYSGDKLISDAIRVHIRPFHVTKWESLYSSLFGTGVKSTRFDDGVEPSFTPIIDESYQVVGHLGWINMSQICIFTSAQGGTALDLQKAEKGRLAKERQQLQSLSDSIDRSPFFRRPAQPATNSPPPRQPPPCRPSPTSPLLKPAFDWDTVGRAPQIWESEEERHQKNFNFFLAAGGTALVGRAVAMDLWDSERYEMYWIEGYRCLALVAPDGHLQGVLGARDAADAAAKAAAKEVEITEATVRAAMKDAPLKAQQERVSLPTIRKYVQMLREGKVPPAIHVDQGMIVEGNHRYIAGRIFGKEPPIRPWAGGRPAWAVPWEKIVIDTAEW